MKKSHQWHILGWLFLLIVLTSTAFAQMLPDVKPLYEEILMFNAAIDITNSGYAKCVSDIEVNNSSNEIDLTMSLQRSSNKGRTWSTIKTWDTSDYGFTALEEGWYVTSGYSFRVKATAEVFDESGNLLESDSIISLVEKY